jgi:hypothetical protein
MNTFTPLFSGIVESSIWDEPHHVRVLWVTMLAIKDFDHIVRRNEYQLHKRANMSMEEVMDGLGILSGPDSKRPGQPFDGRRIEKVDGGWKILNGQFYEDQMREISRRFYKARKAREYRRSKALNGAPLPGEARYVATLKERGVEAADAEM